jgi:hypothetical protein
MGRGGLVSEGRCNGVFTLRAYGGVTVKASVEFHGLCIRSRTVLLHGVLGASDLRKLPKSVGGSRNLNSLKNFVATFVANFVGN